MLRPVINFYASPSSSIVPKLPVLPTSSRENYLYSSRPSDQDIGNFVAPLPLYMCLEAQSDPPPTQSGRRGAVDYDVPPLLGACANTNEQSQSSFLPQRLLNPPESENMITSIWFTPTTEPLECGHGVSMADMLGPHVDQLLVGSKDKVFDGFVISDNEIRFHILWPGYGDISWIACIPTVICESDKSRIKLTRGQLASAIALHFHTFFMPQHSKLRGRNPNTVWKIYDGHDGIRFEQLRLHRVLSSDANSGTPPVDNIMYPDARGSWQAEVTIESLLE